MLGKRQKITLGIRFYFLLAITFCWISKLQVCFSDILFDTQLFMGNQLLTMIHIVDPFTRTRRTGPRPSPLGTCRRTSCSCAPPRRRRRGRTGKGRKAWRSASRRHHWSRRLPPLGIARRTRSRRRRSKAPESGLETENT